MEDAANFEHSQKLTEAERLAIRYADQMQADPRVITKEWYDQLLQYYTEAQVMELAIFVAVNLGFHAVFSTLEFPPARDHIGPGGKRVEREPAPVH